MNCAFKAAGEKGEHRVRIFSIYLFIYLFIYFLVLGNKFKLIRRSSTSLVNSRPLLSNQRTIRALGATPKVFEALTAIPVA